MPPDRDRPEEGSSAEKRPMLALPIPTYEEATSSRNSIADGVDDERAQLLTRGDGGSASGAGNYRPPTVESARTSTESSFLEEFASARSSSEASLRREMEQMEVGEGTDDGEEGGRRRRRGLRHKLSSRISSLGSSLSALSLPGGWGWGRGWLRVPSLPQMSWLHGSLVPVYRLIAVLLALVVVYALLASDVFSFRPPMSSGLLGPFDPASVRAYARQAPRPEAILESLRYLTSFDHIAGTEGDYVQAKWVHGKLASFGLDAVDESKYYVYLNYPIKGGRRVAVEGLGWEANLEEPIMDNNHENTLAFHGNSKAGTAEGPLVYANYGAREDFETLEKQGISVKGAIVLVRYGGTQGDRALKIKAAENHGAIGVLIFSDPKTEGWNWPGNALQRGGVSLMSFITGDVLTPGYPATKDAERVPKEGNPGLVQIPSLPLTPNNARALLEFIKGKGVRASSEWTGSLSGLDEWWTGSLDSSPRVLLKNEQHENDRQPIWNIHGHIRGTDDWQKRIIVGNHRDAWCFGAGDPNSGTAILLEVARVLGEMMKFGYRPSRSISFMFWDAEEYNLVGSTEWVEENVEELRSKGMTYINLDAAVSGHTLEAQGSPALKAAFLSVLSRVPAVTPQGYEDQNRTLRDEWGNADLHGLGAGSDYVAFQDYAGVTSLDFGFSGGAYPYHSCLDNWEWMTRVGDPTFAYHEAAARVLVLLLLDLADAPIMPFNMTDYADALISYVTDLQTWVEHMPGGSGGDGNVDLRPLHDAVHAAHGHMTAFDGMREDWMDEDEHGVPRLTDETSAAWRRDRSARMASFDKHLLDLSDGGGVPGREWFKHIIYAPQAWSGYDAAYFPGIRDAVEAQDWALVRDQVTKISHIIEKAALKLLH